MPVVVSGVCVVVRCAALEERWPGGAAAFVRGDGTARAWTDGRLAAASVDPCARAAGLLDELTVAGIQLWDRRETPGDAALVASRHGPAAWWPWLELGAVTLPGARRALVAREAGSTSTEVVEPAGPAAVRGDGPVVALRPADRPLDFVRREADAAVYADRLTGEEVRVRLGPPSTVRVATADGRSHTVNVDVARTGDPMEVGLMHRDRLDGDAGMLFRYPRERRIGFWMKNTRIPLDILFARADGTVVEVVRRAEPMSVRHHGRSIACAALEVNAGWAEARGVRAGDRLVWAEP